MNWIQRKSYKRPQGIDELLFVVAKRRGLSGLFQCGALGSNKEISVQW